MSSFDLNSIVEKFGPNSGPEYAEHLNSRFYDLLRLTGFDRRFVRGHGAHLFDEQDTTYLDCIGGYACAAIGRNHPVLRDALEQVLSSDIPSLVQWETSPLAVALAVGLKDACDRPNDRVFFVNSGTEGVETAMKFARSATGRTGFACCVNGFHGLTLGSLSLTEGAWLRKGFGPFLPGVRMVPFGEIEPIRAALADQSIAGLVIEPVQGKGVIVPPSGWYEEIARICKETGTLLIADEVQTGLGRAGSMLAHATGGAVADIVVLSKALSGGMVPVGAVLANASIIDAVFNSVDRSVVHSSTFKENAIAMATGLASLQIIQDENLVERSAENGKALKEGLENLAREIPGIREVRGTGLMIGVELNVEELTRRIPGLGSFRSTLVSQACIMHLLDQHRLLAQSTSRHSAVIKLVPPLMIGEDDIAWIISAFRETISALSTGRIAEFKGVAKMVRNSKHVFAREALGR